MQNFRKITESLIYIGGNERKAFNFENIYPVDKGSSFNSYLLLDEKTVLLDTVDKSAEKDFVENLKGALAGKKLDYLIVNHMEPDHCATIPTIIGLYPDVTVVGNTKTFGMIKQFFGLDLSDRQVIVKDGDTLNIGKRTLAFVLAPMVHWPEAMVTYDTLDKTLFSADAFGTFGALDGGIYADEMDFEVDFISEARRYYTNIVGKFGPAVGTLLKKASALEIERICPLHGPIWRKDFGKIIEKYQKWASYTPEENGVVIAYGSIYGNTEQAAEILASKLSEKGVKNIKLFDVSSTHFSYILSECFKYDKIIIACPTYNMEIFPYMELLLKEISAHHLENRKFGFIENGSWAPVMAKKAREILEGVKNSTFFDTVVTVRSAVNDDNMEALEMLADEIAG